MLEEICRNMITPINVFPKWLLKDHTETLTRWSKKKRILAKSMLSTTGKTYVWSIIKLINKLSLY